MEDPINAASGQALSTYDHTDTQPVVKRGDYFGKDLLFWSLSTIGHDEFRPFTINPELNFRALDDCLKSSPKEAARIGQRLYELVSDLAIVNEVYTAVRCQKLRNLQPSETDLKSTYTKPIRREYLNKIQAPNVPELGGKVIGHFKELCIKHPWPGGKHDEQWLIKATGARQCLANYWKTFRFHWARQLRQGGVSEAEISEDIALIYGDLSVEYLADLDEERRIASSYSLPLRKTDETEAKRVPLQTVWGKENQPSTLTSSKTRVKTRKGPQASLPPEQVLTLGGDTDQGPQPLIHLKRENLTVLTHMFSTARDELKRAFTWQHFLNAMIDTGFSVEQGSGSAVSFKQQIQDVNTPERARGSIVFHRPHPDPSIDPVILQSMEKRMRKWFGWHHDIFVEREKSAAE